MVLRLLLGLFELSFHVGWMDSISQYLCMYLVTLPFIPSCRLQSVLVSYCAAVTYFPNTRVSFASDSILSLPPPFPAYISLSEHQQADSFFSSSKSTFFSVAAISLLFKAGQCVFVSVSVLSGCSVLVGGTRGGWDPRAWCCSGSCIV